MLSLRPGGSHVVLVFMCVGCVLVFRLFGFPVFVFVCVYCFRFFINYLVFFSKFELTDSSSWFFFDISFLFVT